jgi:hypothetical protein
MVGVIVQGTAPARGGGDGHAFDFPRAGACAGGWSGAHPV